MERTEPALVPEWLRCTGNVAGSGGSSIHHSDVSSPSHYTRNRSFGSSKDTDSPRFLDRSSSSNSRRSSSSDGSAKHPYGNFSRSHRDKNRDRVKEKSLLEYIWDDSSTDPLASILTSRVERRSLSRSQLQISRRPGEKLPQRGDDSQISENGALSGGRNSNVIQKAVLERDFPSLRTEEKQGMTGIRRALSPCLTSAVQSSSIGNSGFLSGEKWTSALAEVPAIPANIGTASTPCQPSVAMISNLPSNVYTPGGLNMAETLSQPTARARTTTQLPNKSQRLEELAIKQSRQLIPMTPSMPKPLVSSSVDKTKHPKIAIRTNETTTAYRAVHAQTHSAHLANQSRVVQMRPDSASTSCAGKFLVLKPGRENTALGAKDASSACGDADGKAANGQHPVVPSIPTASTSLSSSMVSALDKAAALSLSSKPTVDKRSSQSLAQSRSEFFNLMRRKKSSFASDLHSNLSLTDPSSAQTSRKKFEGGHDASPHVLENGNRIICNGDSYNNSEKIESFSDDAGDDNFSADGSIYPDEEEAAFLRSLGWEENGGEDEGLTEEEINSFYQEYMNRRSSLEERQSSQLKFSTPTIPNASGAASSDSSSSESETEV